MRALAAAFVFAACTPAAPIPAIPRTLEPALHAHALKLPNGLTAILAPDPFADVANVLVRFDTGAFDDPAGREGLAHLAAHVSFAAMHTDRATLWDELDSVATWIDVTPRAEVTDFTEECLSDRLGDVLRLEARRMQAHCEGLTDAWFQWSRARVEAEVRANDTLAANRAVAHALYAEGDPYRRVADVTPDSLAALPQADACEFLAAHYGPERATLVVSGPIDPAAFDALVTAAFATVPAGHASAHEVPPPQTAPGQLETATTDVSEPMLVVSWQLPAEARERTRMVFAADSLAHSLHTSWFSDDHQLLLWLRLGDDSGFLAAAERVKAAVAPGAFDARDFEAARTQRITEVLARLDTVPTRVGALAGGGDPGAQIAMLVELTPQRLADVIVHDLAWDRARILPLSPDGSRAHAQPVTLLDPPHELRGPSASPANVPDPPRAPPARVLAGARTLHLESGLTVVLAPSSPVPLVEISLMFRAGSSAEPAEHPGTAVLALSAFDQLASRTVAAREVAWAVGARTSSVDVDRSLIRLGGPSAYVDHLLLQLEGLVRHDFESEDVRRGLERRVRSGPPERGDITSFDTRAIEAFARRYFQPDQATLVITGGFDPDVVAALVSRTLADWRGHGEPPPPASQAHRKPGAFARVASDPDARVELALAYRVDADASRYDSRMLLAQLLDKLSPDAHARFSPSGGGGTYVLTGSFTSANAPTELRQLSQRLTLVALADPRYATTFALARLRATRATLGGPHSSAGWSDWLTFAFAHHHDLRWLTDLPARDAALSYAAIARVAATDLVAARATWLVTGPRDAVIASYEALQLTPIWLSR